MKGKFRLTTLLIAALLSLQITVHAQDSAASKVTIELTYKDKDGKKHAETKELTGAEAENFDFDAYEKSLADRDIEILNLNINQTSSNMNSEGAHESHDVKIKKKEKGGKKMKKNVVIMKTISADSDSEKDLEKLLDSDKLEIEEKDGKIYINGKEMEGAQKRVRVMKSGDGDMENMKVEVKDGKVFLNGEIVDDADVETGSQKVIIKKMEGGQGTQKRIKVMKSSDGDMEEEMKVEVKDGKIFINGEEAGDAEMGEGNQRIMIKKIEGGDSEEKKIWISKDNETMDLDKMDGHMVFIADDEPETPRLGIAIEDGTTVNGAAVIEAVANSPAAKAGLQKGDVVTAINATKVYGVNSLMSAMGEFKVGDEVKVTYDRGGKSMTTTVKLEMMKGSMHKVIEKEIIIEKNENKQ